MRHEKRVAEKGLKAVDWIAVEEMKRLLYGILGLQRFAYPLRPML
jgi:hypothetical protein